MWARRTAQAVCSCLCLRRCVWVELHARRPQPTGSGHLHGTEVAAMGTWRGQNHTPVYPLRHVVRFQAAWGRKSKGQVRKREAPQFSHSLAVLGLNQHARLGAVGVPIFIKQQNIIKLEIRPIGNCPAEESKTVERVSEALHSQEMYHVCSWNPRREKESKKTMLVLAKNFPKQRNQTMDSKGSENPTG